MPETDRELLKRFLSSFDFDRRLTSADIRTCIAHTRMLARRKLIHGGDAARVIAALERLGENPESIPAAEDVHFAVEQALERALGPNGSLAGIIRTGRSRNDLVAADERLHLREVIREQCDLLRGLIGAILDHARAHPTLPMCGMTHLQPAQPVLFSHYLLAFAWMFVRDIERLEDCARRANRSALGAAAFAGTSFPIDRATIARLLGFLAPTDNSVDTVADRDYYVEYAAAASLVMTHLSRLAEELIIWAHPNFGYIALSEEVTSGSSIMPQKNNPDYLELIRGRAGQVYGGLVSLLTMLKGLPLSYNRDMQEDKRFTFPVMDAVRDCIRVATLVLRHMKVKPEALRRSLDREEIIATELANRLVRVAGIPFTAAHAAVRRITQHAATTGSRIGSLSDAEFRRLLLPIRVSAMALRTIRRDLNPERIAAGARSFGGSSPNEVRRQIARLTRISAGKGTSHG